MTALVYKFSQPIVRNLLEHSRHFDFHHWVSALVPLKITQPLKLHHFSLWYTNTLQYCCLGLSLGCIVSCMGKVVPWCIGVTANNLFNIFINFVHLCYKWWALDSHKLACIAEQNRTNPQPNIYIVKMPFLKIIAHWQSIENV